MPTWRIVGFSGGIDSQATLLWVRNHFPNDKVVAVRSDVGGFENPVTELFVREYSEKVFPITTVTPTIAGVQLELTDRAIVTKGKLASYDPSQPLTMELLAKLKGRFPSTKARFCTEALKLVPFRQWMEANIPPEHDRERYIGVRRDESKARSTVARTEWDDYFECIVHRPICDWSKQQCFDYCLAAGEPVNPLYRMGFGRVGCNPCINSNKDQIRNWAARFPEAVDEIERIEVEVGRTFFPPGRVPGKGHVGVREIVEWSKTARGGNAMALPFVESEAENNSCSSQWGLCE